MSALEQLTSALKRYFAEVDAHFSPVSGEEAEKIITEAMRSTRPNYTPR